MPVELSHIVKRYGQEIENTENRESNIVNREVEINIWNHGNSEVSIIGLSGFKRLIQRAKFREVHWNECGWEGAYVSIHVIGQGLL